jgi:Bacterial SH3 domain
MNTFKCFTVSAGIVALSTGWAVAAPAVVLDYLNLRVGPGYGFDIIEVIPAGWIVGAGGCADGWCLVNVNGVIGYVDANYLGVPVPPYAWSNGYAYWAYPNYAYYYGYAGAPYAGAPYVDPYIGAFAQGRDADVAAGRKLADQAKHKALAKNGGNVPLHAARPVGEPTTTGAAPASVRLNRADRVPPR